MRLFCLKSKGDGKATDSNSNAVNIQSTTSPTESPHESVIVIHKNLTDSLNMLDSFSVALERLMEKYRVLPKMVQSNSPLGSRLTEEHASSESQVKLTSPQKMKLIKSLDRIMIHKSKLETCIDFVKALEQAALSLEKKMDGTEELSDTQVPLVQPPLRPNSTLMLRTNGSTTSSQRELSNRFPLRLKGTYPQRNPVHRLPPIFYRMHKEVHQVMDNSLSVTAAGDLSLNSAQQRQNNVTPVTRPNSARYNPLRGRKLPLPRFPMSGNGTPVSPLLPGANRGGPNETRPNLADDSRLVNTPVSGQPTPFSRTTVVNSCE